MAVDVMQGVAQGRVWSGRDALSVGLVDALGGVSTAVAIAKQAAGLGTLAGTCSPTSRPMKIPWVQLRNAVLFCYQQSTACRGAAQRPLVELGCQKTRILRALNVPASYLLRRRTAPCQSD